MSGVGKLLKQAQRMQQQIGALQEALDAKVFEVAAGGGAVKVRVTGSGRFTGLDLDPEFLKEDAKVVSETILQAVQEAASQSKTYNETEMQKIAGGFQMPGLF